MHKLFNVNPEAHDAWSEMVTNTIIVLVTVLALYFIPPAAKTVLTMIQHLPASSSTSFAAQY